MPHSFLTVAVAISSDARPKIEELLNKLDNPAGGDLRNALRHTLIVHFMSASVVPGDTQTSDYFVLEMSTDGPQDQALALFDETSTGMRQLFEEIFKLAGMTSGEPSAFLKANVVPTGQGLFDTPGLNFAGAPGMSVKRIRREWSFARRLRDVFDENDMSGKATDVVASLRERVETDDAFTDFRDMLRPEPTQILQGPKAANTDLGVLFALVRGGLVTFFWPVLLIAAAIALGSADYSGSVLGDLCSILGRFLAWSAALVILAAVLLVVLLLNREAREAGDLSLPDPAVLEDVRSREDDGPVQNHLFGVSRMKPGYLRMFTLRVAFWVIGQLAGRAFRPGHLGDIGTIHFARWFMIPGTDKLIFCSNYGGSWESYLEDFITKAAAGLTGVWSNTFGFPPARLLFFKGAEDGDPFKRWARRQQIPTRVWYAAYPHITTARIRINAAIRNGLSSAATEDEAKAYLALFASRTRPEDDVERAEIQTIMFGGLGRHEQSACLLMQLPDDPEKARGWLREIGPNISFGGAPDPRRVDQIALSASGLGKLGLDEGTMVEFPYPFRQGMDHPDRARILADTGDDAPKHWRWGAEDKRIDCSYFLYLAPDAATKSRETKSEKEARNNDLTKRVDAAIAEVRDKLEAAGGVCVHHVVTTVLSRREGTGPEDRFPKEPFGFADGISQPVVRGMRRGGKIDPRDQHLMAPGEFLLGYPDNRGKKPLSPRMAASRDPNHVLPVADAAHHTTDYPTFDRSGVNADRDFGRNGTFIVVRQLSQDVPAFDAYLDKAAKQVEGHGGVPARLTAKQRKAFLAAKMVGRWQDGTSLVKYPSEPGTGWDGKKKRAPDNDFLLGRDDPTGEACPYGSHVRRSNPRDSFTPGSQQQLDIVNRHRILRRGRFYGVGGDYGKGETGLLFVCANADLERQFEFIQQTWSVAPQFHGLENEVDPILGRGAKMGRLTIPTPEGPICLKGMPDLVRVIGGGYFFMPSKAALRYLSDG